MKMISANYRRRLAVKSLAIFRDKSKELKHDPISLKLLYAENVVIGANG
jgi:hypothetical protein